MILLMIGSSSANQSAASIVMHTSLSAAWISPCAWSVASTPNPVCEARNQRCLNASKVRPRRSPLSTNHICPHRSCKPLGLGVPVNRMMRLILVCATRASALARCVPCRKRKPFNLVASSATTVLNGQRSPNSSTSQGSCSKLVV
ncbi:hypothetical protein D3C85_576070 [compost metagenome]